MNNKVPDCIMDEDPRFFGDPFAITNQRKTNGSEDEFLELLWQNGPTFKQTQPNKRTQIEQEIRPVSAETGQVNPSQLTQEANPLWFHYPFEDSLEKDLYQEYFSEFPNPNLNPNPNPNPNPNLNPNLNTFSNLENSNLTGSKISNFSHFSRQVNKAKDLGESSKFGTSIGSNVSQLGFSREETESTRVSQLGFSRDETEATRVSRLGFREETETTRVSSERVYTSTNETTATSSSGGSGGNFEKKRDRVVNVQKRKGKEKETEGSESHSEDERIKPTNQSTSKRRSRAAEVHNLSERRRRDRINEKMRSLQELIPHCNKTDKASILDEAIEYLKSLQMQLQLMWMGGGVAPMMYPGMNALMGPVNPLAMQAGFGVQIPRMPFMPAGASSSVPQFAGPALSAANFQAQMQGFHLAQQQQATQVANLNAFGSQIARPSSTSNGGVLPIPGEFNADMEKR
ncbi:hypothetical protein LUZ60_010349 [Juncus effusus]|nr:hypothetical protein LUZ60_010349 [Juncus effusus]